MRKNNNLYLSSSDKILLIYMKSLDNHQAVDITYLLKW